MTPNRVAAPQPLPLALVADADAGSREMYVEYLKLARWGVVEAADGPEALAVALSRRPDLIVADSHLPGISGCELCDLLGQDLATRTTPFVLITSDTMARELERARSAGASSVLLKPCLPETLLTEAVRLLEQSRQPRVGPAVPEVGSDPLDNPERAVEGPQPGRRRIMSRSHRRGETELPPSSPPRLICPGCDRELGYKSSQVGGVSLRNAEQWDYFVCSAGCGTYQYRQRTRKLRRV